MDTLHSIVFLVFQVLYNVMQSGLLVVQTVLMSKEEEDAVMHLLDGSDVRTCGVVGGVLQDS